MKSSTVLLLKNLILDLFLLHTFLQELSKIVAKQAEEGKVHLHELQFHC